MRLDIADQYDIPSFRSQIDGKPEIGIGFQISFWIRRLIRSERWATYCGLFRYFAMYRYICDMPSTPEMGLGVRFNAPDNELDGIPCEIILSPLLLVRACWR